MTDDLKNDIQNLINHINATELLFSKIRQELASIGLRALLNTSEQGRIAKAQELGEWESQLRFIQADLDRVLSLTRLTVQSVLVGASGSDS